MVYDFVCKKCREKIEVTHGLLEPHPTQHDGCGGELVRIFVPVNIIFKGSGFYSTDHRPVKPEAE